MNHHPMNGEQSKFFFLILLAVGLGFCFGKAYQEGWVFYILWTFSFVLHFTGSKMKKGRKKRNFMLMGSLGVASSLILFVTFWILQYY